MAQFVETTLWEDAQSSTAGVIKDVKILGQRSRNKRFYTEQAMQRAVPLYEGKAVYISHASKGVVHRPAPERYGRLTGVRYDAQRKQLRGDLVYLESQAQMTAMVKEDLSRGLNFFGLSHAADGAWHMKEGIQTVTTIDRVTSVDLVSDPATATSLREQEDAPAAPGAAPADAGPDPKLEALRAGVNAILDKGGSVDAIVTAITEFLETMGDAASKGEETPAAPKAEEQTTATVAKLTEQIAALTATVASIQKPKKYVTAPTAPANTLTEQTAPTALDVPPKDPAALKKWLRAK